MSNYRIVTLGGQGRNGRLVGHVTRVHAAVYDLATLTVTLDTAQRLDIHNVYRLVVIGKSPRGLMSAAGVPLDSQGNAGPGAGLCRSHHGQAAGRASSLVRGSAEDSAACRRLITSR